MTKIEWTDETWNPVTGCDKVSQGCKNCYAEVMHKRLTGMGQPKYSKPFLGNIELHVEEVYAPLFWKKPRMVFVNSMSDLFHHDVPFSFIDSCFDAMDGAHWHTFQILTKRAERMLEFYQWKAAGNGFKFATWPLRNVWIGVSCEDQKNADERIPFLLQVPATVRFLSCEPLLGEINLIEYLACTRCGWQKNNHRSGCCYRYSDESEDYFYNDQFFQQPVNIDWVIVGGESGHHARPVHPDWIRSLRDQCAHANIPFFFKQWGEYVPISDIGGDFDVNKARQVGTYVMYRVGKSKAGNIIDGKQHLEFPKMF